MIFGDASRTVQRLCEVNAAEDKFCGFDPFRFLVASLPRSAFSVPLVVPLESLPFIFVSFLSKCTCCRQTLFLDAFPETSRKVDGRRTI